MLKLARRAYAVFKAYFISEFVRSKGGIFVLLSIALWIVMFILPMFMFAEETVNPDEVSAKAFLAIMLFLFYSTASWDWAAEMRWMINDGRVEYYIASGSGFLPHFLGVMPVSLMWILIALCVNYVVLSIMISTPRLYFHDFPLFLYGFTLLLISLISYALILGGSMISTGTTGFIVEIISFVLPVATGGLLPLRSMPMPIQQFALMTPFSYPAEIIRYSVLGTEPVLSLSEIILIGLIYNTGFLLTGVLFFRLQLRKIMRTGFKSMSMW